MSDVQEYLVPLLAVFVTGFLGVATYAWHEGLKRKIAVTERKQGHYETLLRDLFKLLVAEPGADQSKLISDIEKSWLFASDGVLRACYEYLELHDEYRNGVSPESVLEKVRTDNEVKKIFENVIAKIFLGIRRDVRFTRIRKNWARKHTKIYDWGIIAKSD